MIAFSGQEHDNVVKKLYVDMEQMMKEERERTADEERHADGERQFV